MIATISKIKDISKTRSGKSVAHIVVRQENEPNKGKEYDVTVWLEDKQFLFKQGDTLDMDIRESGSYRGKTQYSSNIEQISPIDLVEIAPHIAKNTPNSVPTATLPQTPTAIPKTPETPKTTEIDPQQKMWAYKEQRDFRGRCLMYATTATQQEHKEAYSAIDFAHEVIAVAEMYMNYIYKG